MKRVEVFGIEGMPEIERGANLARSIVAAADRQRTPLADGDALVVSQKVVSKAEGRIVRLAEVEPGAEAASLAARVRKEPRLVEVILRESRRVVRAAPNVLITETRHGFVCANAGVDASNVPPGTVSLLPLDPDRSAATLREAVARLAGADLAVIVSDTFGRPWRNGLVNVALGVAGLRPLRSYVGMHDPGGLAMQATIFAEADELAAAAELVQGKLGRIPAAVVRGHGYEPGAGSGRDLLRDPAQDLFR